MTLDLKTAYAHLLNGHHGEFCSGALDECESCKEYFVHLQIMTDEIFVPSKLDCPICTPVYGRQFMEAQKQHYICSRCSAVLILTENHQ